MLAGMKKFNDKGVCKLNKRQVRHLFHAIDMDHSGEISYTEFISAFLNFKNNKYDKYLKKTF